MFDRFEIHDQKYDDLASPLPWRHSQDKAINRDELPIILYEVSDHYLIEMVVGKELSGGCFEVWK